MRGALTCALVVVVSLLLAAPAAATVVVRPGAAHDFHEGCAFGLAAPYPFAKVVETWNGRTVPQTSIYDTLSGAIFHYDLVMPWGEWHTRLMYDFGGQTLHNSKRLGSQVVRFHRACLSL